MRILALWFPDWPIQAALLEEPRSVPHPVAIIAGHRVHVCNSPARRAGVRRGMRVRQAQALCPDLVLIENAPDRDSRMFESIATGLDEVASAVEVIRPGLVIVEAGAAGRYHGSEDHAAELLIDAAARRGVDCLAGIADQIATALIAARLGQVVPVGQSADFLHRQPLSLLVAETALGCEPEVVAALTQLGIRTLGELAELPRRAVSTRFGRAGEHCHRIASAAPDRNIAPAIPVADLAVSFTPEEPMERVDTAAFVARSLAARLHQRLSEAALVCLRLKVVAEISGQQRLERIWRTRQALGEQATAERVRWQLDGWLRSGGTGGITGLTLEPMEVAAPEPVGELWRSGADTERTRQVIARVQSTLGVDAVLQPRLLGGRGVAERIGFVAYGEQREDLDHGSWPGRIPGPLPARLGGGGSHPAARVVLVDRVREPVIVTAEALLSGRPHALAWGQREFLVVAWAGPWPVDVPGQRCARLQLVGQAGDERFPRAWLLRWVSRHWRIEAIYG